jgi:hypothetical protein
MDGVGEEKRLRGRGGKGSGGDCVLYALALVFIYQGKTHTIPHPGALGCAWYLSPVSVLPQFYQKTQLRTNGNYGPFPAFDPR